MILFISQCSSCGSVGRQVKKLKKQCREQNIDLRVIETKKSPSDLYTHKEYAKQLGAKNTPPILVIDDKVLLLSDYLNEAACDFC